jgi:hypothetical protein
MVRRAVPMQAPDLWPTHVLVSMRTISIYCALTQTLMSNWSLGLVRKSLGTSSGGVGLVLSRQFGLRDETWDIFFSRRFSFREQSPVMLRTASRCGDQTSVPTSFGHITRPHKHDERRQVLP